MPSFRRGRRGRRAGPADRSARAAAGGRRHLADSHPRTGRRSPAGGPGRRQLRARRAPRRAARAGPRGGDGGGEIGALDAGGEPWGFQGPRGRIPLKAGGASAAGRDKARVALILFDILRDGDDVFHTYSAYARGTDLLTGTSNYLDLTALGRQEFWEEPAGRANSPAGGWWRLPGE